MLNRLQKILKMTDSQCHSYACNCLKNVYKKVYTSDYFIYTEGASSICLVAHMDTVRTSVEPLVLLIMDKKIYSCDKDCLGADDRAGVLAILIIVEQIKKTSGLLPSVLFTHGEEIGCIGANAFAKSEYFSKFKETHSLMLELDRKGYMEMVNYAYSHDDIIDKCLVELGFKHSIGSCSDISVLTRYSDIPSYNLSIGYYNQHTSKEYLNIVEYKKIIKFIPRVLDKLLSSCKLHEFRKLEAHSLLFNEYDAADKSYIEYCIEDLYHNNLCIKHSNVLEHIYECGFEQIGIDTTRNILDLLRPHVNAKYLIDELIIALECYEAPYGF